MNKDKCTFSGQIPELIRDGAGVPNSWSWTESNFHPDDPLDTRYTDPTFTPDYTLKEFADDQIYEGKSGFHNCSISFVAICINSKEKRNRGVSNVTHT